MLFRTRRFLPLFLTQFLGALNDNLLKSAMGILIAYRLAAEQGSDAGLLVTASLGVFILPFFLFSATAGRLADAIDRARIARGVKLAEILLMGLAVLGFATSSIPLLMLSLFLMGTHSAFFGPIKYSLLPQHLEKDELLPGNAYVETGTFLAILIGTIMGGQMVLAPGGITLTCAALLAVALGGYAASRFIPPAPPPAPGFAISFHLWRETLAMLGHARRNRRVFRSVIGISWFWLIGAAFISQFPLLGSRVMGGDQGTVTLMLTVFSLGSGLGSLLCNKLLRGQVQSTYVPLAAAGMTLGMLDFAAALHGFSPVPGVLRGVTEVFLSAAGRHVLLDLLIVSVCGGLYIVPLYALMQQESDEASRARVVAANNVMNAGFMAAGALLIVILVRCGMSLPQVFLVLAALNGIAALYISALLPDALMRSLGRAILGLLYRVEVSGLEHYRDAGKRVLLVANHTSFLDAALIAAYLPEKITFAVNTHIARRWWMRPLLCLVDALPLDPTNPLATKALIGALKEDRPCMIFPEGRITVTGALMKIYEGPGMIADKAGAVLLPIRIDGAQYTPFSRLKGKVRRRWFPKIRLTILPPERFALPEEATGRHRRQLAGAQLHARMAAMMFESGHWHRLLFEALLDARATHGGAHPIAEDVDRHVQNYRGFVARSLLLGRWIARQAGREPRVGILLPTSSAMAQSLFGLSAYGRVPALLNFSAGAGPVLACCQAAALSTIVTSRRFLAQAKLEPLAEALAEAGLRLVYLDDLAPSLGLIDRAFALLAAWMPDAVYRLTGIRAAADAEAMILFTSGSEGQPKGVSLSHANLLANGAQMASVIDFGPTDIVFNCLPMFHAFGLTGGTLLPLLAGIKCVFYPSPLHYRIVPELIYDSNATILFGTDTFLAGYARMAHPYDLHSVRYVFAGAEKLKDETRRTYMEKFGLRVFEGYGATETAPVIACNTPMRYRAHTVGPLLPGIEARLTPVPGIAEGGELAVKGPNVMRGYYRAETPGMLQPLEDGWYATGDIVAIDADGFVTIAGRTKRFAKIGGEMVSLAQVEAAASALWPERQHAAISLPEEKKGERIVLVTTAPDASREALQAHYRQSSLPELALPRLVHIVPAVPLLGTGKTDYGAVKQLVEAAGMTEKPES